MQSELPVRVARFVYRVHLYSPRPNEASVIFTNTPCVSRFFAEQSDYVDKRLSPRQARSIFGRGYAALHFG